MFSILFESAEIWEARNHTFFINILVDELNPFTSVKWSRTIAGSKVCISVSYSFCVSFLLFLLSPSSSHESPGKQTATHTHTHMLKELVPMHIAWVLHLWRPLCIFILQVTAEMMRWEPVPALKGYFLSLAGCSRNRGVHSRFTLCALLFMGNMHNMFTAALVKGDLCSILTIIVKFMLILWDSCCNQMTPQLRWLVASASLQWYC